MFIKAVGSFPAFDVFHRQMCPSRIHQKLKFGSKSGYQINHDHQVRSHT
jgi:hypothetical protein